MNLGLALEAFWKGLRARLPTVLRWWFFPAWVLAAKRHKGHERRNYGLTFLVLLLHKIDPWREGFGTAAVCRAPAAAGSRFKVLRLGFATAAVRFGCAVEKPLINANPR